MSVLSLFIAICAVLLLSIFISIINAVLQMRITSRIALLEKELEKKSLTFDSLKKERTSLYAQAQHDTPAVDMSTQLEIPTEPQLVDDGEIRVMRNVRGTFAPVSEDPSPALAAELPIEATRVEAIGNVPVRKTAPAAAASSEAFPDDTKRWNQGAHSAAPRPYAPAAPRRHDPQAPAANNAPAVIGLFSQVTGGADFNALYNKLIATLKTCSTQTIAFDCGGIQYFSGPELEYLGKIHQSLVSQNRKLLLVNCSNELGALLQQQQELALLIR
jgi:hypothetical protein